MKLMKWLFSVVAVAVAVAGVIYLLLTRAEWILDRLEYAGDCIKDFFGDIVDRFFVEDDFCECCCGADDYAPEDICEDCAEESCADSVSETAAPAENGNE